MRPGATPAWTGGQPFFDEFAADVTDQARVPVDGALVVDPSTGGGRSFQTLRQGQPQRQACDLMPRHALDVAADGRAPMMGRTSGGLRAGDDGGDHWQTISPNLSPIAAARFGHTSAARRPVPA